MSKIETLLWLLYKQRLKNDEGFKRSGSCCSCYKDGEMIISEGFGYRNLETKALLHRVLCSQSVPQRKLLAHFH